jgi:hypothetical protein
VNNELYIGRLVWNRLAYVKNPNTGRRVSRLNNKSALIITDVPELRVIDQDLWERVKQRQRGVCTENLNSHIVMMKSAKDCMRHDASGPLDRTRDWRILVQRSMCSHFVVTASVGSQDAAQMCLA